MHANFIKYYTYIKRLNWPVDVHKLVRFDQEETQLSLPEHGEPKEEFKVKWQWFTKDVKQPMLLSAAVTLANKAQN